MFTYIYVLIESQLDTFNTHLLIYLVPRTYAYISEFKIVQIQTKIQQVFRLIDQVSNKQCVHRNT